MTTKKLITLLIKEELRNKRLMYSLEDLGFDCSFYSLDISHVILELAGFKKRPDELYAWYLSLIDTALEEITFWNLNKMINNWSKKIYTELLKKS